MNDMYPRFTEFIVEGTTWVISHLEDEQPLVMYRCYKKLLPNITASFEEEAITSYIYYEHQN